jgi:hypothetical protein
MAVKVEAADNELVSAGGEEQGERGHLEQASELGAVDLQLRVESLREGEAAEEVDEVAGRLDGGEDDGDEKAEHGADHEFEDERDHVGARVGRDVAGGDDGCHGERGKAFDENGGAITMKAIMRTPASITASIHSKSRSMRTSAAVQQAGDAREQVVREGHHFGDHPVARDEKGDRDGRELGHEGERDFLDLRDRLQQRDGEADDERHDEDRRTQLGADDAGLQADVEYRVRVHQPPPW